MPLSAEERGLLDKQIDEATKSAPAAVKGFRVLKHKYHFKEVNDAVYGFILGAIVGSFNQWMSGRRTLFRLRVSKPGKVIELDRQGMLSLVQSDAELGQILMRAFILRRVELVSND